jgi:hypothetical protein
MIVAAAGTAYRLSAVALKGNINGKVSSIEHTTSAPGVHPAVVLTPGQSTTTTLTFNAALTDPETAAYVCLEKTEGLTLPTAEEILRDGKAIAATGEILIENLKPSTTYVIAAAYSASTTRSMSPPCARAFSRIECIFVKFSWPAVYTV